MSEDFMRAGYVRKQIKAEMGALLRAHGFKLESELTYYRKTASGFNRVPIGFSNYAPEYKISIGAHIRLDAVQAVVNHFIPVIEGYESSIVTLRFDDTSIFGAGPDHIIATNPEELAQGLATLEIVLVEKVLPLFDRCTDVKSAWALLSENPTVNYRRVTPYAQMANLTLARLNASQQFDAMVQQYRDELAPLNQKDKERFEQLVAYLYANVTGD